MRPGKCHHARPRAPTHTRAPGSPPPDGVRGGGDPWGARVVWVVEYMCIYEPGHIRCRCRFRTRCRFRPTPSLRCAPLRGSVIESWFEGWPGSARRQRRGTFTRPVSPRRALRRWGAGRPRVLGRFRSQAERLSSGRRVEARSASLRSVNTPAPRASRRPRAPTAIRPVPAPSCTFVPGRDLQTPLRGRVSDSDGLLPRPSTPGRVRPRKALRRAYTTSEESRCRRSGNAPHLRSERGRGAAPRKCDDTHLRNAALDLHRPPGWGLIDPSPPRERNSSDRPPQSSGGAPARPEELTRGVEIPGQPGGSAGT